MLAPETDAASLGGREPRLDALTNKIALELGKTSDAHELAARCAQVESQAMLRKHADLPAVEVVKGLHQVLCAPAPAAQLGDQDCVNLVIASAMTFLRSTRSFLAPEAVSLNTPTILCPARLAKALLSPALGARTIGRPC